ncbi:hypothetical protein ACLQ29_20835 [Micromonospora sp. DT228]|uniref:hypothetical protein n=1 Tax=Micromonospora sp. DT228 TaxID=3393443 RepID=UPI003CEF5E65
MQFEHSPQLRDAYPDLVAGVVQAAGITATADVAARTAAHLAEARRRLAGGAESGFPEIQAWRRAYAAMGLRPTKYRCAAEALHPGCAPAVTRLVADLVTELTGRWSAPTAAAVLTAAAPRFRTPAAGDDRGQAVSPGST